jgi:hypothetical protein
VAPGRFPDPARILVELLDGYAFATATVKKAGIVTPSDLDEQLPYIRVRVGGGLRDHLQWKPTATLDIFAPTYELGWPLVEDVDERLTRHRVTGIDRIGVNSGPQEIEWIGERFRSWRIGYEVVVRRLTS